MVNISLSTEVWQVSQISQFRQQLLITGNWENYLSKDLNSLRSLTKNLSADLSDQNISVQISVVIKVWPEYLSTDFNS